MVTVESLSGTEVNQVCIGSCTNSSLYDLLKVAALLKGRKVAEKVSLSISCGSKQTLAMLSDCGALTSIISSGARLLECACGPCIGMGFSPSTGGVSLRTFNRNFEGRSGTKDAKVYLVSPETDENEADGIVISRGPNIKKFPDPAPQTDALKVKVSLKVGDNITTDHIMPAGAKILPYRSNIPYLSKYCFAVCDETFPERAKSLNKSVIIGGSNYGQGSSREHAALVPLYLGIRAVIAKSFARIHAQNLINAGIMPLTFKNESDYDKIGEGDEILIENVFNGMKSGEFVLNDLTRDVKIPLVQSFTERQIEMLKAGGLLSFTTKKG